MCFQCETGNKHIPTASREIDTGLYCGECLHRLTKEQVEGTSAHYCINRYILIKQKPSRGKQLNAINEVLGDLFKKAVATGFADLTPYADRILAIVNEEEM